MTPRISSMHLAGREPADLVDLVLRVALQPLQPDDAPVLAALGAALGADREHDIGTFASEEPHVPVGRGRKLERGGYDSVPFALLAASRSA